VILVFLVIEGALVQARVIPSGSMEDTVLIGDHLIVSRIGYDAGIPFTDWHIPLWRNPKRQQIIVFRAPLPEQGYPDFIKRTIGVPGDHIKIVGGKVYVNDVPLNEPYAASPALGAPDGIRSKISRAKDKDYTLRGPRPPAVGRWNMPTAHCEWRTGRAARRLFYDGRQSR
jgi:signal peptidase I